MRRSVMFALAYGATAAAALPFDGVKAANAWGGSYCMTDREGRQDCSFITLAQCQASASGTDAGCYAAPQALLPQQGVPAAVAAPTRGRRGARLGSNAR